MNMLIEVTDSKLFNQLEVSQFYFYSRSPQLSIVLALFFADLYSKSIFLCKISNLSSPYVYFNMHSLFTPRDSLPNSGKISVYSSKSSFTMFFMICYEHTRERLFRLKFRPITNSSWQQFSFTQLLNSPQQMFTRFVRLKYQASQTNFTQNLQSISLQTMTKLVVRQQTSVQKTRVLSTGTKIESVCYRQEPCSIFEKQMLFNASFAGLAFRNISLLMLNFMSYLLYCVLLCQRNYEQFSSFKYITGSTCFNFLRLPNTTNLSSLVRLFLNSESCYSLHQYISISYSLLNSLFPYPLYKTIRFLANQSQPYCPSILNKNYSNFSYDLKRGTNSYVHTFRDLPSLVFIYLDSITFILRILSIFY